VASSSARRFFSSFLVSVSFFTWSRVSSSSALIEEHDILVLVFSFNKKKQQQNKIASGSAEFYSGKKVIQVLKAQVYHMKKNINY
jgi:hypothetical protein